VECAVVAHGDGGGGGEAGGQAWGATGRVLVGSQRLGKLLGYNFGSDAGRNGQGIGIGRRGVLKARSVVGD